MQYCHDLCSVIFGYFFVSEICALFNCSVYFFHGRRVVDN